MLLFAAGYGVRAPPSHARLSLNPRHRNEPYLVSVPGLRAAAPPGRGDEAESETLIAAPSAAGDEAEPETLIAAPSAADRAASRDGGNCAGSSRISL